MQQVASDIVGEIDEMSLRVARLREDLGDNSAQVRALALTQRELTESLAKLVTEVRQQNRLMSLNSFVAYVLYTVLVGAVFYVLYRGRVQTVARVDGMSEKAVATAAQTGQVPDEPVATPPPSIATQEQGLEPPTPSEPVGVTPLKLPERPTGVWSKTAAQAREPRDSATSLDNALGVAAQTLDQKRAQTAMGAINRGDFAAAESILQTKTNSPGELLARARLRHAKGDAKGAAKDYASLAKMPGAPTETAYYHALALADAYRPNQSRSMLKAFVAAHPSHPFVASAQALLAGTLKPVSR